MGSSFWVKEKDGAAAEVFTISLKEYEEEHNGVYDDRGNGGEDMTSAAADFLFGIESVEMDDGSYISNPEDILTGGEVWCDSLTGVYLFRDFPDEMPLEARANVTGDGYRPTKESAVLLRRDTWPDDETAADWSFVDDIDWEGHAKKLGVEIAEDGSIGYLPSAEPGEPEVYASKTREGDYLVWEHDRSGTIVVYVAPEDEIPTGIRTGLVFP